MRFSKVFYATLLLLASCATGPEKNLNFLNDSSLTLSVKIEKYLASDSLLQTHFSNQEISLLKSFYNDNGFNPCIAATDSTLLAKGKQLKTLSLESLAYGVPQEICSPITDSMHPVEQELRTIVNLNRILSTVKNGFFHYSDNKLKTIPTVSLSLIKSIVQINNQRKQSKTIIRQGPVKDSNYRYLAEGIYAFTKTHTIDTLNYDLKKDKSIKENPKKFAIASLRAKGYMDNTYDLSKYQNALLTFKTDNGLDSTYDLNDYTLEALAESNKHRLTRAAISLDKIRSHAAYGPRYVRINIPEYQLYFYANDSLKAIHRVVVGKRDTQTPELVSEIRTIIIYPYWKVPTSIIKKEIMPDVYKNPGYLAKHHYKLCRFNDTTRINPASINWSNRPGGFNVIQMPGPWNSLGVIKFEFLSNHSVYVHDTPQKGFFNRKVRSFSHGCMRCQYPVELGKLMLQYDQEGRRKKSMPPDTLDSLVRIGEHVGIGLKNRIPIYVEYQTVTTHEKRITFHLDIYFREDEIIKILAEKNKKHKTLHS